MTTFIQKPAQQLQVKKLTGRIGAEISGIHLSSELDSSTVQFIHDALLEHKVLFFRGQQHLGDTEQEKFAELFGSPVKHPTVPAVDGTDFIFELDSQKGARANSWHTDVTFVDAHPKISILRSLIIPETGGDTTWANTETAYEDLPELLQQFAEQLVAVHSNEYDYGGPKQNVEPEQLERLKKIFVSTKYETEHPVVVLHPETGKKSLLLGHFFKRLVGFSQSDSQLLFNILQEKVTRPENTVRWQWQEGDVVIWDNRSTQHYAVNDYGDQHRVVRRITLAGEVTTGVHGLKGKTTLPKDLSAEQLEKAKLHAVLNAN
ncbi:TauD/TfdA family dioxygenase [Acinetobacter baumannii]|nr:TauD/TfdA family dioxygenase [Acinetobacter baumannii]